MKLIVILAAYNGVSFIEDQIKSIQAQTCKDWSLLIRDDGSKDGTSGVVRALAKADPRITLVEDTLGNLGAARNFAQLLQAAQAQGADYVAISDQDDIWLPEKLQVLLDAMKETEAGGGALIPVLVHSDLEVVDKRMRTIHRSFMECSRISPLSPKLESLLCQNFVTGCTCLINRPLLALALPVPQEVPMHDWWLALLALACGKMAYVPKPLVRYRQHGSNVVGVKPYILRVVNSILNPGKWRQKVSYTRSSIRQAVLLIERLQGNRVQPGRDKLQLIRQFSGLMSLPRLQRLRALDTYRIRKHSRPSDVLFRLIVLSL